MYPDNTNVVIVTSFEPYPHSHKQFYNAFIAEARGQSDKIFLRSLGPSLEQALLNLLCLTNVRVGSVTKDVPVDSVQAKHLKQNVTKPKGQEAETGQNISEPQQSSEEEATRNFHQALGRLLDMVSKELLNGFSS